MTTLQIPELLKEILDPVETIPDPKLAYFRTRLRLLFHEFIVGKFYQQENMTKAELARRIGKRPEVINRLLGAPGNWTLDTISDLLLAMASVPVVEAENVITLIKINSPMPQKPETIDSMASPQSQSVPVSGINNMTNP